MTNHSIVMSLLGSGQTCVPSLEEHPSEVPTVLQQGCTLRFHLRSLAELARTELVRMHQLSISVSSSRHNELAIQVPE